MNCHRRNEELTVSSANYCYCPRKMMSVSKSRWVLTMIKYRSINIMNITRAKQLFCIVFVQIQLVFECFRSNTACILNRIQYKTNFRSIIDSATVAQRTKSWCCRIYHRKMIWYGYQEPTRQTFSNHRHRGSRRGSTREYSSTSRAWSQRQPGNESLWCPSS